MDEILAKLKAVEDIMNRAEYLCGAPHWQQSQRWDVQAKLFEAHRILVSAVKELCERSNPQT